MEKQYLKLLQDIVDHGDERRSRNSVVKSVFARHMSWDLADGFPLLTTKKMFFRGIVEELAWFLRGSTDARELQAKHVHIWDGNSAKTNGDCGPIYSFQWRYFGADYVDCTTDYTGQGIDQVQQVVELLKQSPTSRRMVISGWNPTDQSRMCLPPCHVFYQFYVEPDNRVSCMMTQRSADVFLGLPFNIASTSLLLTLICQQVGRQPGKVHLNIGDAHVYQQHMAAVQQQLTRRPTQLPRLALVNDNIDLWKLQTSDIYLQHRSKQQSRIKADMVA